MVGFFKEMQQKTDVELVQAIEKGYGHINTTMIEIELHRRFTIGTTKAINKLDKSIKQLHKETEISSKRMYWLTWAIGFLTFVMAALALIQFFA